MNRKASYKIIVSFLLAILIIMTSSSIFALTPGQIKGDNIEITELSFMDRITDFIRLIGTFLAVGVLMVLGIKYMMGSLEERASYKKSMMPYIVGCFILFGASYIVPSIIEMTTDIGDSAEDIGNKILGLIQVIGTFISVGALMLIGIRYMLGSTEERASYKKSMMPYIIGAIVLFGAVNIVSMIYNAVPKNGAATSYYDRIIKQYGEDNTQAVRGAMQSEMSRTENKEYKDQLSELLYKYEQQHMVE